jgi:hypothetical protein
MAAIGFALDTAARKRDHLYTNENSCREGSGPFRHFVGMPRSS